MREIKFRAWSTHKNKMFKDITLFSDLVWDRYEETHIAIPPDWADDFVLMQFTDLKDTKRTEEYPEGQEIYEGDIIKGTVHDLKSCSQDKRPDLWHEYIVKFGVGEVDASDFEQYEVEIIGFYLEKVCPDNWASTTILRINGMEVIGNIHQNPDLLEKK